MKMNFLTQEEALTRCEQAIEEFLVRTESNITVYRKRPSKAEAPCANLVLKPHPKLAVTDKVLNMVTKHFQSLGDEKRIALILVESNAQAEELISKLKQSGINHIHFKGRTSSIEEMCVFPKAVKTLGASGMRVQKTLCAKNGYSRPAQTICPHFGECKYQRQIDAIREIDEPTIVISSINHLTARLPELDPDIVIVSGSSFEQFTHKTIINRSDLLKLLEMGEEGDELSAFANHFLQRRKLSKMRTVLEDIGKSLRLAKFDEITRHIGDRLEIIQERFSEDPKGAFREKIGEEYKSLVRANALLRLCKIVHEEKAPNASEQRVTGEELQEIQFFSRREFPYTSCGLLIVDPSADRHLTEQAFDRSFEFVDAKVAPRAVITQCSSRAFSTSSILGTYDPTERSYHPNSDQQTTKKEIDGFIQAQPARAEVIAQRDVSKALREANSAFEEQIGTFGNDPKLKSEKLAPLVLIGRTQPSLKRIQTITKALWFDDPSPVMKTSKFFRSDDAEIALAGGSCVSTKCDYHPDPRCQMVLYQMREELLNQLILKNCPMGLSTPREVSLLTNIPVPLPVTVTDQWKDMKRGFSPFLAYATWCLSIVPFIPLTSGEVFKLRPDLFATQRACKTYMTRQIDIHGPNLAEWTEFLVYNISNLEFGPFIETQYGVPGVGGKKKTAVVSKSKQAHLFSLRERLFKASMKFQSGETNE